MVWIYGLQVCSMKECMIGCRLCGAEQVTQKNIGSGSGGDSAKGAGRDGIMDLLVMENILYARNTARIYDLKVTLPPPLP